MANSDSEEVSLVDLIIGFTVALKRNLLLTILIPLFTIVIVVGLGLAMKSRYESTFVLETSLLSENECRILIDEIEDTKQIPGISLRDQKKIRQLEVRTIKDIGVGEKGPLDERAIYLSFKAKVTDSTFFPVLQKALFNFVNNSPAVVKHRTERDKYYHEIISKIDEEMTGLEQVKKEISGKAQATYLNPSDLYAHSVALFKEKTQYEIKREEIKNLHIIKEFTPFIKIKPNLLIYFAIGLLAGIAILAAVLFFKFISRNMPASQKAI